MEKLGITWEEFKREELEYNARELEYTYKDEYDKWKKELMKKDKKHVELILQKEWLEEQIVKHSSSTSLKSYGKATPFIHIYQEQLEAINKEIIQLKK